MATVNLGNIKFIWKGAYNASTAYIVDDVVSHSGSSYICILASTGNAPTNTTYWQQMSAAGTDGTDLSTVLTTQGDTVVRGSSGLERLAIGTAGQTLKVNSSANGLEFGSGSKVLGMKSLYNSGNTTVASNGSGDTRDHGNIMGGTLSYTPQSTSSKIFITLTSGIGGLQDKNTGGFGLSLSASQSGGISLTNYHASEYGFYDLNTVGMSYGDSTCISIMQDNSSTNAITVTGQGYWYDESPDGQVQFRKPCLTLFEFEE